MIIKKGSATKETIAKEGIVWDIPLPDEKIGLAVQELNGRVPDKGAYRNKECYEVCYILEGSAHFFIDDKKFEAEKGDTVIIKPKEKSYLIAEKLKMVTITNPNFYEEQCERTE